jgi:hypothetical protein
MGAYGLLPYPNAAAVFFLQGRKDEKDGFLVQIALCGFACFDLYPDSNGV